MNFKIKGYLTVISFTAIAIITACSINSKTDDQPEIELKNTMEAKTKETLLFIGTYTKKEGHVDGKGDGVYVYSMNNSTGELTYKSVAKTINPTYLAVHPNKEFLYVANEYEGDSENNFATLGAYKINKEKGELEFLTKTSANGLHPCYIEVNTAGNYAMAANYTGGSVGLFPISKDGAIHTTTSFIKHEGKGPTDRQEGPHGHMITQGRNKNYAYAVDLGTDNILVYGVDVKNGLLTKTDKNYSTATGAGPRHLSFHPTLDKAYVVNELNGTIEAMDINPDGKLSRFQTLSTVKEGEEGSAADCAAIKIHSSGRFLYASNRRDFNNIAIYNIDQISGELNLLGHESTKGLIPRDFEISPDGVFLLAANQNSNNIFTFRINQDSGLLEDTGLVTDVPSPVCLKFL